MTTNGNRSLHSLNGKTANCYYMPLSTLKSANAIKGVARMLLNAINHKKVFRFPLSVFRFLLILQKPMAKSKNYGRFSF